MRVGLFTDAYLPEISGVTTTVRWLKDELEREGHEAYVYAPQYLELTDEDPRVFRFRARPFVFYGTARLALPYDRRASRTFRSLDVLHSHSPFSLGLVALAAGLRYHIPHVHTYHTYLSEYRHYIPHPFRPPKKTAEDASAAFCNRCTAVTAPSTPIKNELLRYGVRRPIYILPFGVNLLLFEREPVWNPRQELGIPRDSPLFLYSGRLAKEKNLSFLVRAFGRIHAHDPRSVLVLAGDGPERGRLESQASEEGLGCAVIFTGFLDHPRLIDLYKAADLFLFSSKTETQGLVLVEAMAGGAPAVAIGEMGVLDVVTDGVNGILAPEEEETYASLALDLLADRTRYESLRLGALRSSHELSSQNSTRRLLEIFQDCLSGNPQAEEP
jgi:glycosyltransferase involved in cell wall biosynthesis